MPSWYERSATLVDSASLNAASAVAADVEGWRSPTVLVTPEDLEGNLDVTVTIRAVGDIGTYRIDERTVSATDGSDDYTVDVPRCEAVELESSNSVTCSAEVRENHG